MKTIFLWLFLLFCGAMLEHTFGIIPPTTVPSARGESANTFFYKKDW